MGIKKFADIERRLRKLANQDDDSFVKMRVAIRRHFENAVNKPAHINDSDSWYYIFNQGRIFVDTLREAESKITGSSEIYILCDVLDDLLDDDALNYENHPDYIVNCNENQDKLSWANYVAGLVAHLFKLGYLRQADVENTKYGWKVINLIHEHEEKTLEVAKKDEENQRLDYAESQKQKEHTEYIAGFNAASKNNLSLDEQLNLLLIALRNRLKPQSRGIITGLTANDSTNPKIKPILTMINNGNLGQAQAILNNILNDPFRNATLPKVSWP